MKGYLGRVNCLIPVAVLILVTASPTAGQRRKAEETMIQGHTMYTVLKPGDIPAIFAPEFIAVGDAGDLYYDDEPLLAVADDGAAKAYSTWHLDHHEVVNDRINGTPITPTW